MKAIIAALLLAMGLSGCATKEPDPPRIEYRFIAVPVEMTERISLSTPPEPQAYSTLSCDAKEKTLMDVIQERTKELGVANTRLLGIRDWSVKQSKLYGPPAVQPTN